MKELSITEKAKRYDEVLAMAKECITYIPDEAVNKYMLNMFPELRGSEDEQIRKELTDYIKSKFENSCSPTPSKNILGNWIAWLEKQDFNYTFEIKEGHWYKCVCDYMLNNSDVMFKYGRLYYCRRNWRLDGEIDEINVKDIGVNGYKSFFRPATNQEIKDWLEKQGEQKTFDYKNANIRQKDFTSKSALEAINEEKVEPKFKVSKWYQCTKDFFGKGVTFDKNTAYYCAKEGCLQDEYGCHIAIVKDLYDNFKLWTIEDANDGDVLANDTIVLIVDHLGTFENRPIIYSWYFADSNKFYGMGPSEPDRWEVGGFHPATKEQRDLLFQKMKEAGYEWNSDKKELIKL